MRRIREIILHCSANSNPKLTLMDIRADHVVHRGWKDVGYHYFIRTDGLVEHGRDVKVPGAHCYGRNSYSIGICLNGLKLEDFTNAQFDSLRELLKTLKHMSWGLDARIDKATLHAHNEFAKKACPVFDVTPWQEYWKGC